MPRRLAGAALALAFALPGCADARAPEYRVKGPIEAKYQAQGPFGVKKTVSTDPCDREKRFCDIWYPAKLEEAGGRRATRAMRYPVVSWANGSGQKPEVYDHFLRHLASWGFIVVATRDESTGNGDTTEDAASYVVDLGRDRSSVFFNKVDADNVGAAGHSQGGAAVTSLQARGSPLFKTFIGFHTSPSWFAGLCCKITLKSYRASRGTASIFQWSSKPDSGRPDWYDAAPSGVDKAYALLTYTKHGDIGQGASSTCSSSGCGQGPAAYLGYATAWLVWHLQNEEEAAAAFTPNGEFVRRAPGWTTSLLERH